MTTRGQTLEYVAALTAELAKLTRDAGQPFLAYLLALAQAEATEKATFCKREERTHLGPSSREKHSITIS